MKTVFVVMNLLYGIVGLLLGIAAASGATQNPVAAVLGIAIGGLAIVCLWQAWSAGSSKRDTPSPMA